MQTDRLTLSQFQQLVTNAINKEFGLKNVWVQAEFSDLRVAGGHCYMELVEGHDMERHACRTAPEVL